MLKLRHPLPIFRSAKEIVCGQKSRLALKGVIANKVALIVSKSFEESQYRQDIITHIGVDRLKIIEKDWNGEPTFANIPFLVSQLESFKPDYIVALGGGSVIDSAKVAWLLYEDPTLNIEVLKRNFIFPKLRVKAKFGVIPTTIGSGSEVSSSAVIIDEQNESKKTLLSHEFLPDFVILEPNLLRDVPKSVLRTTIADSLSHAIEGYTSRLSNPLVESFAEGVVRIINQYIKELKNDVWSDKLYEDLQIASLQAGWVQNHCAVGLSHAIAHQLGSYQISHGLANALLMPATIRFNEKDTETSVRYAQLCQKTGLDSSKSLCKLFEELTEGHKTITTLNQKRIEDIANRSLLDPIAKFNPRKFSRVDAINILKESL